MAWSPSRLLGLLPAKRFNAEVRKRRCGCRVCTLHTGFRNHCTGWVGCNSSWRTPGGRVRRGGAQVGMSVIGNLTALKPAVVVRFCSLLNVSGTALWKQHRSCSCYMWRVPRAVLHIHDTEFGDETFYCVEPFLWEPHVFRAGLDM